MTFYCFPKLQTVANYIPLTKSSMTVLLSCQELANLSNQSTPNVLKTPTKKRETKFAETKPEPQVPLLAYAHSNGQVETLKSISLIPEFIWPRGLSD